MNLKHFEIDYKTASMESIKKQYRDLMKKNHPDHGGDVETAKEINAELEWIVNNILKFAFDSYQEARKAEGKSTFDKNLTPFVDILMKIIDFDVEIEVIGYWIYAFKSKAYKDVLKSMGFWYSGKWQAWVYNGSSKTAYLRTKLSKDQVRSIHGSEKIGRVKKEEEERKMITA